MIALQNPSPSADRLSEIAAVTGVGLDLAVAYVEADYAHAGDVQQRICAANGGMAFMRFSKALHKARDAGEIVVPRWTRDPAANRLPAIAPASESYPVHGAALAAHIAYGEALAWVDAPESQTAADVAMRITNAYGLTAWAEFTRLIMAAWNLGHVRIRHMAAQPDGCAR